jgi:hypothetical protein
MKSLTLALVLLLLLTACGGGGGAPSTPAPPATPPISISTTHLPSALEGQQYRTVFAATGGRPPYSWNAPAGFPAWASLDAAGAMSGTPTAAGVISVPVNVQDSSSPPLGAAASLPLFVVAAPPLQILTAGLPSAVVNRQYRVALMGNGGTPPYRWGGQQLPPGLALDLAGAITGVPESIGTFNFNVVLTDSAPIPHTTTQFFTLVVRNRQLGRNDTLAQATRLGNGTISASISPYADPATLVNPDTDYYKLRAFGGQTVAIQVHPDSTPAFLDVVLEILDANGTRFTSCRDLVDDTPRDFVILDVTPLEFNDACLTNGFIVGGVVPDARLEFQVPGNPAENVFLYAHLLDWEGRARPDLTYTMTVSGVIDPIQITPPPLPAAVGVVFSQNFFASGGTGAYTWLVAPGSALPPGLALNAAGLLSGTPSTAGTYTFSVQVTDGGVPSDSATIEVTMTVSP